MQKQSQRANRLGQVPITIMSIEADACEVCDNCGKLLIECECHEDEITAAQAEQLLESMNDFDNLDEDEKW